MLKCQGHFGRLGSACQDQQFAYLSQCEAKAGPHCLLLLYAYPSAINQGLLDAASANRTGATANSPFGYDPVFGTYSSLWNIQLVGQEGSFYNLTTVRALSTCCPESNLHAQVSCLVMLQLYLLQGSGEADFSGNPFGFMDEKMPGAIVDFPALFTTEMSANRSADVLQYLLVSTQGLPCTCSEFLSDLRPQAISRWCAPYLTSVSLQDGKYLANGVQQMQLRMVAYNGNARLFGYFALRLTWNRDGSITSSVSFAALQVVPYSAANAE